MTILSARPLPVIVRYPQKASGRAFPAVKSAGYLCIPKPLYEYRQGNDGLLTGKLYLNNEYTEGERHMLRRV
jgi:hypothetical protein